METAEASGKTVEDALERALSELGASRDEVEMTVLDEGRKAGLFGRGGKDAMVRVTRLGGAGNSEAAAAEPAPAAPRASSSSKSGGGSSDSARPRGARERSSRSSSGGGRSSSSRSSSRADLESPQPRLREEDFTRPPSSGGDPVPAASPPRESRPPRSSSSSRSRSDRQPSSSSRDREPRRERAEVEPDINAEEVDFAAQIVDDIMQILDIDGSINIREPLSTGDGLGSVRAVIDISGEDLGLLIGRRGDTLQALQYLVNLIVGRRYPDTGGVTIDVEHYRHRREEQIVSLARRMADRVRQTHSAITLEPMPPAERRIIHILFVDDPEIQSSSIGEGESRKVVISPRP